MKSLYHARSALFGRRSDANTDTDNMNPIQQIKDHLVGNDKDADLKKDTQELNKDTRLTTDYGVKYPTYDDWLRVASDDKNGPMLLEDPYARERVGLEEI